jgi:N-acetylmuramoyl-L-alanine amidase
MKPAYLIVHHTGGSDANPLQDSSNFSFADCEVLHKQRFNFKSSLGFYTGYQYFIDKSGKVWQARKDDEEGAHTIGYNTSSIGICLAGNFDATLPTNPQINALRTLLQAKMKQWNIPLSHIHPHRWAAKKTCYGRRLSDTWAQNVAHEDPALIESLKKQIAELQAQLTELLRFRGLA